MARVQIRNPSQGRDYYERKNADGKAPMEAMRCVKRRLSDLVYQQIRNDALAHTVTGPGGQQGNDSDSSVTDSHPSIGSSDKPLPGPATTTIRPSTQPVPRPHSPRPLPAPTRSQCQAHAA
jgi:transposase